MHTTTFHNGTVVRFRDGAIGIVVLIDARAAIVGADGGLRALQASEVLEHPAVCPTCRSNRWYWKADLRPCCRTCEPPSPEWESALLGRAMAALHVCRDDKAFLGHARTVLQRDFETWDLDRLLICAGAHALHERLTNRKREDRS